MIRRTRHGFGTHVKGFKANGTPRGDRVERVGKYRHNRGRWRRMSVTARKRMGGTARGFAKLFKGG